MKRGGARERNQMAGEAADGDREKREQMEEALTDISIDDLREFLEADVMDVPVDPEFKERLRQKLWALVQERAQRRAARGPRSGDD